MIVSVHQPQYLPWIGYFDKIKKSDIFVFLDNVQYKKREFQNRNKIRTKNGWIWLTVPVITKGKFLQNISEVEIDNTKDWQIEHYRSIELNYTKTEFFHKYKSFIEEIYKKKWSKLLDINICIIKKILEIFNIKTEIHYETEFNITTTSTQRIIDICKKLNADTYMSGIGGKNYLDEDLFIKNNIKLIYQNFKHPVYKQNFDGFQINMSIIDFLFNCGNKTWDA